MRELRDPRDIFSKIWYYDKVLMIEDLPADGNRMETIRDPVIVRDGAEAGIDGIGSTINGDVDGKVVGGGI